MSPKPVALEPPGEDVLDLPAGLGWFVGLCTWLRRPFLGRGDSSGRGLPVLTSVRAGAD